MTAFTTCPFLTFDSGLASLTEAVPMTPSRAYRPVHPPIGLIIAIFRLPDLSATAPNETKLVGHLELPHGLLDAHPEQLVGELAFLRVQLVGAQIAQLRGLHNIFSCANRVANLVRIESLAAASRIASRASFSLTPS